MCSSMCVHGSLSKYLLMMLISLIFGVGMAFGGCPCNNGDQSISNAGASSVSSSSSAASTAVNNPPNMPTMPSGPGTGKIGRTYRYTTSATDPDGDTLKYTFDWGDGVTSVTRSVKSGISASSSHTWGKTGTYRIKVMATDSKGATSIWSSRLVATIS
jgi:hypothetical protein